MMPDLCQLATYLIISIVIHIEVFKYVTFQIRNGRTKSNLKKIIDHFSDTYNLMDFVAVCMFMVAFGLKASTPYVCSQVR